MIHSVILAAGQGTRMKSRLPKVLQQLAGKSLLAHVLDGQARAVSQACHVVIGHGGDEVKQSLADAKDLQWVLQAQQLGTGHAVQQALPSIPDEATVLVLYGDVPLVSLDSLRQLCAAANDGSLAILTVTVEQPQGYGRILRNDQNQITGIVEQKDASPGQLGIREVNTGLMAAPAAKLKAWVKALNNDNAQGEYYLTDCVALAVTESYPVTSVSAVSETEVSGVNDRKQLASLERAYQQGQADALMADGVQLMDPARIDVRGVLSAGRDCKIDINCLFEGEVQLGDDVLIGPNCYLRNTRIESGSRIEANSVLEDAVIGPDCQVGPFARIRPGTRLAARAKVGNFVETKKTEVGEGSKINHLSYVGDAVLGRDVNVGAGTITCNYDGVNKHQTIIEDGAFIGSDSALVAPVTIGAEATIGAGSVISKDAPAGQLTVARGRQKSIAGWQRPKKKES